MAPWTAFQLAMLAVGVGGAVIAGYPLVADYTELPSRARDSLAVTVGFFAGVLMSSTVLLIGGLIGGLI